MPIAIVRPISNVTKSWKSSDRTFIDDEVTNPTIGGTSDANQADKNDDNEVEVYGCTPQGGTVTEVRIDILAKVEPASTTLKMTGSYTLGGTTGAAVEFTVTSTTAWYSYTWSGLSLDASSVCQIRLGTKDIVSSSAYLYVYVAYLTLTYTTLPSTRVVGGVWKGGRIR